MPSRKNYNINDNAKYLAFDNRIMTAITDSKTGSKCAHNRGPACSVEYIELGNKQPPHISLKLEKDFLLKALKNMIMSRISDEKHLALLKQGKSFFHIGCSGHEAIQTAVGFTLKSHYDWGWTYYRDLAYMYALGYKPEEYFLLALSKPEDPATGGRQMANHYGHPELNQPSQSSPTGTQFLNAVGTAMASRKLDKDEITYVSSGEGTTSQGEFYEAVNWASREKLPVLFVIQDNGYAISVPRELQSMGSSVGHSFCCYSNLKMKTFDGTNFFESIKAVREAVDHIRSGKGPVLLHAYVERLLPHSSSDDHRKYRPLEELERAKIENDPIGKLSNYLIKNKLSTDDEIHIIWEETKKIINDAADWAMSRPEAKPENSTNHIFAPAESRNLNYSEDAILTGEKIVMVDAINHALHEEMSFNDKMIIFGEDIADPKGGVFTATKGLSTSFGKQRVFNSPLAEASIIGVAVGLAVRGFKPVVEIQFGDYIWPAFMQFRNELSTLRYRSDGRFSAPVVVRVAVGGYIHGGLCHSQNIEAFFSHIPGLLIAYPSTASDAKGLLKTACRLQDPVLFCEHKGMYRMAYSSTSEPDENYLIPFGKGKILNNGSDATIVTWGMSCKDSLNAARQIFNETGKSIEIIDLRTIIPWDKRLVLNSIKKTNRVLIVHEDTITMGFGAEIASFISSEAFTYLDAPVLRLAAKDSHIPYNPIYEADVLPNENKIVTELKRLIEF